MKKNTCTDFSILIPVRIDSIERLENIQLVVHSILKSNTFDIKVYECSSHYNGILHQLIGSDVEYTYIEDCDPIFYRTHYINLMTNDIKTKFIAVWDADILINPIQLHQALELLRSDKADFVIPYEKQALDTTPILRKLFLKENNIHVLEQNQKKMKEMYAPNPLGGIFIANRDSYINAGLENEDFYGWGMEDIERFYRWKLMGYKIKRVPGPLFHLSHGRGINSKYHYYDQGILKRKMTLKVKRLAGYGEQELE